MILNIPKGIVIFRYCMRIKFEEVKGAMHKIRRERATGSGEISVEF